MPKHLLVILLSNIFAIKFLFAGDVIPGSTKDFPNMARNKVPITNWRSTGYVDSAREADIPVSQRTTKRE
jgi:hypothetical protein